MMSPASNPTFAPSVEQWDVQEVTLRAAGEHDKPFTDVRVRATFSAGSTTVAVDGFHDGGRSWKLRLMPEAAGEWTFTTASNVPELDGLTGAFTVEPAGPANHGPVRVSGLRF